MKIFLVFLSVLVVASCSYKTEKTSFENKYFTDAEKEGLYYSIKSENINSINQIRSDEIIDINNTVWLDTIGEECINFIKFKTSLELENYICELDFTFEGNYSVNQDTIHYSIKGAVCEDCDSIAVIRKGKFIIQDNNLFAVYREYIDYQGRWVKEKIEDFTAVSKYKLANPE